LPSPKVSLFKTYVNVNFKEADYKKAMDIKTISKFGFMKVDQS
jgi:hypothetical protein